MITASFPRFCAGALIVALLFLAGCQAKAEYWVNPDGTGKAVVDYTMAAKDGPLDAQINAEAIMSTTKGARQWTDVTYKYEADHGTFHGTVYFDDLNQLQLGRMIMLRPIVTKDGAKITSVAFETTDATKMGRPLASGPKLSDEEIKAKAAKLSKEIPDKQAKLSGMEKMITDGVKQSRFECVVHLPGKAKELTNLELAKDGGVKLVFDGGKYADAYSKVVSDEALLVKILAAGENPERQAQTSPVMNGIMIEKMWGTAGPIAAKVDGDDKPLFDYKSEVEKTKVDYVTLITKAGLLPSMPALNKENELVSLEAAPAKIWSAQMPTATINARGETVTKFYRIVVAALLLATDENGKIVVPAPGGSRRISATGDSGFAPSNNEPMSKFNLTISVPKGPKAFKEIKGMFTIMVADSAEETDLGTIDFKSGAKGPALGFSFADVSKSESEIRIGNGPAQKQSNTSISASFDTKATVVQIKILDSTGKVLLRWETDPKHVDKTYYMQTNTQFPEKVQVKIVTLKNPRLIDVPFEFGDVPVEESKK